MRAFCHRCKAWVRIDIELRTNKIVYGYCDHCKSVLEYRLTDLMPDDKAEVRK